LGDDTHSAWSAADDPRITGMIVTRQSSTLFERKTC
jgi:hypothetical protein